MAKLDSKRGELAEKVDVAEDRSEMESLELLKHGPPAGAEKEYIKLEDAARQARWQEEQNKSRSDAMASYVKHLEKQHGRVLTKTTEALKLLENLYYLATSSASDYEGTACCVCDQLIVGTHCCSDLVAYCRHRSLTVTAHHLMIHIHTLVVTCS